SFSGMVEEKDKLYLMSIRAMAEPRGVRVVEMRVAVTPEFLALVAPDLGAIQLNLTRRFQGGARQGIIYSDGGVDYETAGRIPARNRVLHRAGHWLDPVVTGLSRLDAMYVDEKGSVERGRPVLVTFNARPSRLNARIFSSLGELSNLYVLELVVVSVFF